MGTTAGTGTATGTSPATTGSTNPFSTASSAFNPGTVDKITGQEQTLSNWAAPYVVNMLGQAQALGQTPYQTYGGPLTAGASDLQKKAFEGIGGLTVPGSVSGAAQAAGDIAQKVGGMTYTPGTFTNQFQAPGAYQAVGGSFTDQGMAQQYMNPYMQAVLDPQMQAMQRQADIQRSAAGAQAAKQGAFGGTRAGLMGQQIGSELMRQQQQATGQAYQNAFQQAQQQYNAEQARKIQEAQFGAQQGMTAAQLQAQYGLSAQQAQEASRQYAADFGKSVAAQQLAAIQAQAGLGEREYGLQRQALQDQLAAGATQRGIEQEGITANLKEFEAQRDYPYKQLQFMQSMLQNFPMTAINYTYQEPSDFSKMLTSAGGLQWLYENLFGPGQSTNPATTTKP